MPLNAWTPQGGGPLLRLLAMNYILIYLQNSTIKAEADVDDLVTL